MPHSRAQLRRVHTRVEKQPRGNVPAPTHANDEADALFQPATGLEAAPAKDTAHRPRDPDSGAQLPGN